MRGQTLGVLALLVAVSPASGLDRATYRDGTTKLVDLVPTELEFSEDSGASFRVPDYALQRLTHVEGDSYRIALKDGTELRGILLAPLELREGLVMRTHPAGEVVAIDFDVFLEIEPSVDREQCPIRVAIPLPMLQTKEREWLVNGLRRTQCNGMLFAAIAFERNRRSRTSKLGPDGKKRKMVDLWVTPSIWLPEGQDKYVELTMSLEQDGRQLAQHRRVFETDEGENNRLDPIRVQYVADVLDAEGPAPTLKVQLQDLPERGVPTKDQHPSGWFSVWLTQKVINTVNRP